MFVKSPHNPKISVIMAVKDGQKYLHQAIDSVLGQTFSDFEFIIVDDCSADGSLQIIENYDDSRITLIKNRHHLGLSGSLNVGLSAARSEYIARIDADDICLSERFEKQVCFLDQNPSIAVLGTGIRLIDEHGKTIQDVHLPLNNDLIKWQLCFINPIAHPSVMMRGVAVKQVGGYNTELIRTQDYDLWWRLSVKYQLANLSDILVLLRQHSRQISKVNLSEQFEFGLKINQKHLSSLFGHEISEAVIRNLWTNKYPTVEDALLSGQLVLNCFHKTRKGFQSRRSLHLMVQDATFKIHAIIRPFLKKPKIWFLLWRIFLINPLPSLRFLAKRRPGYFRQKKNSNSSMNCFITLNCPKHGSPLHLLPDRMAYRCDLGCMFEVKNQIPRFVDLENYAASFGLQWNVFRRTQLDSYTGIPISKDRLTRIVGGSLEIFKGKNVLEAGCGAGRFTEIMLEAGANVFAIDLSVAVDANFKNFQNSPNYFVCQADILNAPVAAEQFDIVVCIGVIQSTPDSKKTIEKLCSYLKPKGMLFIDHYTHEYPMTNTRIKVRNFLRNKNKEFSLRFIKFMVGILWPLHVLFYKFRNTKGPRRLRRHFLSWSPVVDYHGVYTSLGNKLLRQWAILDTHDTLTDHYKNLLSAEEILRILQSCDMIDIQIANAGNGVEARAQKKQ
jgi:glycosyltransferase involved in cell wall biosynthesis/SAM-dependent methyltransferase